MDVTQYLRLFRRYWRLAAACVVIAVVIGWVTTPSPPQPGAPSKPVASYRATHTLIRSGQAILSGTTAGQSASVELLALLATTGEVPVRVAERLGHDGDPALLMVNVDAAGDSELGTLTITATEPEDGGRAARLANAVAEELTSYLAETSQSNQQRAIAQTGAELQTLQKRVLDLSEQLQRTNDPVVRAQLDALTRQYSATYERQQRLVNEPPSGAGIITLQRATPVPVYQPASAFSAPRSRVARVLVSLAVGAAIGLGLAYVLYRFGRRLRSKDEVEAAFDLPVVGEVPPLPRNERQDGRVWVVANPFSAYAEEYRRVRTAIDRMPSQVLSMSLAADHEHDARVTRPAGRRSVILVTSPGPGEGKTTTVANLAACFAETGRSVLVVSADVHRADLDRLLLPRTPSKRASGGDDLQPTTIDGVQLLSAGSSAWNGKLRVSRPGFVPTLRGLADVVLIDGPPLLASTEAADLAPDVDAVLLVARSRRTSVPAAQRATELLARLRTNVLGVVLVEADERLAGEYADYFEGDPVAPVSPSANGSPGPAPQRAPTPSPRAPWAPPAGTGPS